jgi:histone deacetylase 1/2
MDNANTREYLDKIRNQVIENLKRTAFAPSVQMTDVPRNPILDGMDDEADDVMDDLDDDENKDKRFTQRRFDQYTEKAGELSDSEDEEENAANGVRRQPGAIRRRNQANYRNLEPDSGLDSGMATPQDASSAADGEMDSTTDAKMADAPRTEPEAATTPAPKASLIDETLVTDADRGAVGSEEQADSTTSQRQSLPHDEDTTMEDAAVAAEPTALQQATHQDEITNSAAEAPHAENSAASPARVKSPLNEAVVKDVEPSAELAAPAAETDAITAKEEKLEHTEEPKKEA